MNKSGYFYGNPFKVFFRQHRCFRCGNILRIRPHRKIVNQTSEEARYYDFSLPVEGRMIGPCEFVHNVFHCEQCEKDIEFYTQTSIEDIDSVVSQLNRQLLKEKQGIFIRKIFETSSLTILDGIEDIQELHMLSLVIDKGESVENLLTLPKLNKRLWERPAYFKIHITELKKLRKKIATISHD